VVTDSPTILAIDDRQDDLILLGDILAGAFPGAKVLTALNGARGIELALAGDPDVILLDAVMPVMDGFEVCRRLKADERVRHIPVVFVTGLLASRESRIRALDAGGEAFLSKPFDEVELTAQIRAMIRIKAARVSDRQEKQRLAAMVQERTRELESELAERGRAEDELRRAQAELAASYAAAPVALLLVDRAAAESIGLRVGEALRCLRALDDPRGCGFGPDCGACPVRRAVLDTFALRQGRDQVEASIPAPGDADRRLLISTAYLEQDGAGQVLVGAYNITGRKRAEEAQRASDARYRALFENMLDGFAHCRMVYDEEGRPVDFIYLEVNPRFEQLTGLRDVTGKRVTEVIPGVRDSIPEVFEIYGRVALSGKAETFEIDFKPLSRWLSVSAYGVGTGHFIAVFDDISERKRSEIDRDTMLAVLRLANASGSTRELIRAVTAELRAWAGCEAVGIRLKDGDDFPYFETRGFPAGFVEAENSLCLRDEAGALVRDPAGNSVLECMCGNILCGRFDPRKPFFTEGGSFWTNGTTRLLASTAEADRQARTRNRCNGEGYESVALIPLRCAGRTFGLLQLNDRRPDRFTPEKIALMERAAGSLAMALEQRLTQAALRESEQRLAALFERAPLGYQSLDADGRFLMVNEAWLEMLGYQRQEVIGRSYGDFLAPEFLGEFRLRFPAFKAEGSAHCEFEMLHRNGERRCIAFEGRIAHKNDGTFEQAHCILQDITERRRAEEALRESAGLLRKVGELAHFGGWSVNLAEQRCYWSDEVAAIHEVPPGYSPPLTEAIGCYTPEWRGKIEAVFGACARDGAPFDEEMEIVTARGNRRWVRSIGEAVRDASGAIVRVQGAFQDVTARKRAEEALRDSERRFRLLVESSPDAIVMQTGGRIAYLNGAAVRLFGADTAGQLLGAPYLERYRPDLVESARERMRIVSERQIAVHEVERVLLRLDGSQVAVEVSAAPIQYQGSEGGLVFIRDITERSRAAAEREKLREQLTQAQKMESIGRLAGGVAHDFNNLLTVINGYSSMLLEKTGAADPQRVPLEEIRKAGERAAGLTQQLLAFSRKQVLQPRVLDLNRVVEGMRPMLARMMGEDVELRIELHPEAAMIEADPHRLEQVLMNLAVNARDAMPDGGALKIATSVVESGAAAGSYAVLEVSDTGVGMDEETRRRIFEPFFTTKGVGKGTGLGLSMILGIVEQSGGHIDVESTPGVGTAFQVYLPKSNAPAAEDALPEGAAALGERETVLVVEDQADVRRFVTAALRAYSYVVIQAESAAEALRFCEPQGAAIDLVLTDVVMPNMSGRELAGRLAVLRPGLKVLFMSGYASDAAVRPGAAEQGREFIQKPFSPDQLARKIRDMLAAE
jgi:PAS domain S-box-containing protein